MINIISFFVCAGTAIWLFRETRKKELKLKILAERILNESNI